MSNRDALLAMICYTRTDADEQGLAFTTYLLDLAAKSLADEEQEIGRGQKACPIRIESAASTGQLALAKSEALQ